MGKYEALEKLLELPGHVSEEYADAQRAGCDPNAAWDCARHELRRRVDELRSLLADVRERDEVIILTQLNEIHSAMDRGLGDSDPTHVENDSDLKREYPLYWAAFKLAKLIQSLESNK